MCQLGPASSGSGSEGEASLSRRFPEIEGGSRSNMTANIRYKSRIPVKTGERASGGFMHDLLEGVFLRRWLHLCCLSPGVAAHPCTCVSSSFIPGWPTEDSIEVRQHHFLFLNVALELQCQKIIKIKITFQTGLSYYLRRMHTEEMPFLFKPYMEQVEAMRDRAV